MDTPPTLLIVEDEILTAISLQTGLEDAGYQVMDLTSRPGEALAAARARKPDLALVNIKLYGSNDGIALASELKTLDVPVLFISGQPDRAVSARSAAVGSLPKPYSVDDMVAAVGYLLARLAGDATQPRPQDLEVFDEDLPEAV
ncbi:response regulator [Phenylobacterium sp. 20VBR1]|uniref:Response regulator n=1 Tax=Phenylobacterium glaciei TaxID=2803784 RepID=A0A941HV57_9CAUL|nr:response regulator [Phenylobacterium glaciei]MBR7618348.1 response regulator [Phenylobacterium glaciei]